MGATLACLLSEGTHPSASDFLKIMQRGSASTSASSFRILGLMLSGPSALFGLSVRRSFSTPSLEISMSGMGGALCWGDVGLKSDSWVNTDWNCAFKGFCFLLRFTGESSIHFNRGHSTVICFLVLDIGPEPLHAAIDIVVVFLWGDNSLYILPVCLSELSLDCFL